MNTFEYDAGWQPPEPSRASRKIQLRSIASYRGTIVDPTRNRAFDYESQLERDFLYVALASSDVEDVHEQPPAASYVDHTGKRRQHTFDALLTLLGGRRIAVALKPSGRVGKSGIQTTLELIREQVGEAFADRYVLRTERHLHPDDVADARLILRARSLPDPGADRAAADIASTLRGWCRLSDLAQAIAPKGVGFNAVVRRIGAGDLFVKGDARISLNCLVRGTRN